MTNKLTICSSVLLATGLLLAGTASAFDMGNMMNPSKWMGGNNDDDDYYYDDYSGGPGGYPPPGYGYPGPGYGGYGAPGYGAPGGGYGAPGYGAPGGGYGAPAYGGESAEISRLKERIRMLEESNREIPAPSSYGGQQGYQQVPGYGGQPAYQQTPPPAYGNPQYQYRPLNTN